MHAAAEDAAADATADAPAEGEASADGPQADAVANTSEVQQSKAKLSAFAKARELLPIPKDKAPPADTYTVSLPTPLEAMDLCASPPPVVLRREGLQGITRLSF